MWEGCQAELAFSCIRNVSLVMSVNSTVPLLKQTLNEHMLLLCISDHSFTADEKTRTYSQVVVWPVAAIATAVSGLQQPPWCTH